MILKLSLSLSHQENYSLKNLNSVFQFSICLTPTLPLIEGAFLKQKAAG